MLTVQAIKNVIEIHPQGKVSQKDFETIAPKVDKLIEEKGSVCLFVDAREFKGWDSFSALRAHFKFVKARHVHVKKAAIVIGHLWQKWLVQFMRLFLHPQVRMFHPDDLKAAKIWLQGD